MQLKTYNHVVEDNALHVDWKTLALPGSTLYIIDNPPFVGQSIRTREQSDDMAIIWGKGEIETKLDYVICWYKKAMDYIKGTAIKAAFVSTNSIC